MDLLTLWLPSGAADVCVAWCWLISCSVLVLLLLPGDLRFEGVCLRYFPGGPLALRHVNFHVQDCEKVGQMKQGASPKTELC
jgi:ABC-type multidrug transport system fused ATPase/permease subunit